MIHKIAVEFDTSTGLVDVKTEGDEPQEQVLVILETVRKELRRQLGLIEILVQHDPAKQTTNTSFDPELVKTWGYFCFIMEEGKKQGEFNDWFSRFMMANQNAAQAMQNEMQNRALAAQLKKPGLRLS